MVHSSYINCDWYSAYSHFLDGMSAPESDVPEPGPETERLKNRLLGVDGVPSRD